MALNGVKENIWRNQCQLGEGNGENIVANLAHRKLAGGVMAWRRQRQKPRRGGEIASA
jgi:hypothetical protein